MEYKVSVIVPIYNQEKNLDYSIPCLINQSWKNIEIIAVNDGSTDKSESIIDKYAFEDKRILKVNKKNGGLVDAVITGINVCTGQYICFLDPDDTVGPDFIKCFMNKIESYDFIAMGYYECDGKSIYERRLDSDNVYNPKQLVELRNRFLFRKNTDSVSSEIFISRWNKCYKASVIKGILRSFEKCKKISLGEDSIFTYLVLNNCSTGIVYSEPNTYIYNTGSSTSMMKTGNATSNIEKSKDAYYCFSNIIKETNGNILQADMLFYFLCTSVIKRLRYHYSDELNSIYKSLLNNKLYQKAKRNIRYKGNKQIQYFISLAPTGYIYHQIYSCFRNILLPFVHTSKWNFVEVAKTTNDIRLKGFNQALLLHKHRKLRLNAFIDLNEQLPTIEHQVTPLLERWINSKTNLYECTMEKNIFLFWYDGFDNAPIIVKQCKESVVQKHPDFSIICVDKNNYRDYTNIHPLLIEGFENGIISIQTFSDILRFNLLKENGGIWIDSTLFFVAPYDIYSKLMSQSFNTVSFLYSDYFIDYNGIKCSWSGFYCASRKNSVFVSAMYDVFERYYLKHKAYPIYFFIDALYVIFKKNKIDNSVLDNTQIEKGDMFWLANNYNRKYSNAGRHIASVIPQKLSWMLDTQNIAPDTYYKVLVSNNE